MYVQSYLHTENMMIKVKDSSGVGGDGRVLCVEQTTNHKNRLALWPERNPGETVWITPDDAAELAARIAAWAVERGGVRYKPLIHNLTGYINFDKRESF